MGIGLMMLSRRNEEERMEHSSEPQIAYGTAYPVGDDEFEMRRRSRRMYEQGYEDAIKDAERIEKMRNVAMNRKMDNHFGDENEEMEMRRRRRMKEEQMVESYRPHYADMIDRRIGGGGTDQDTSWQNPEKMGNDSHWTEEEKKNLTGKMGFDTSYRTENEIAEMRAEMKQMRKMQEKLMEVGKASISKVSPKLGELIDEASMVIKNPPSTWPPYLQRGDFHGIVKMEGDELMEAIKDKKPVKDIKKELTHTIAALMLLISE